MSLNIRINIRKSLTGHMIEIQSNLTTYRCPCQSGQTSRQAFSMDIHMYVTMYFRQRMNEHFQLLFAGFCEPLVRGSKGYRVPAYNVQCLPTLCLHVDDADLSDIT